MSDRRGQAPALSCAFLCRDPTRQQRACRSETDLGGTRQSRGSGFGGESTSEARREGREPLVSNLVPLRRSRPRSGGRSLARLLPSGTRGSQSVVCRSTIILAEVTRMAQLDQVKTIGVLGAGQMGSGIAQVAASCGLEVVLVDASVNLAAKAKSKIEGVP